MNNYHLFWRGILSNWAKAPFTVWGMNFTCGEQAMMWAKAKLFNDKLAMLNIMEETNPKKIKALGRGVHDFDEHVWKEHRYRLCKEFLTAKFTQCEAAKKELLKYKGKTFVEASPYDRIWGIGYAEEEAMDNIANWGENLLGKLLTDVSKKIE